jgi:predicted enzyme related to lactoylglutathione lyase
MPQPVVHFEIGGRDAVALRSFYQDLFGWSINADNPMNYGVVPPVEGGIGGGVAQATEPFTMFYIQVDDPQAALDEAVRLGGKVAHPVDSVPGTATWASFFDPEGNVIGLVAAETPPAG